MTINIKIITLIMLAMTAATANTFAASAFVYQQGSSNPWGQGVTNQNAMNAAFGAGNWSQYNAYSLSDILSAQAAFLDGSDSNANELHVFIDNNRTALENYVSGGGRLFINSAPNQGTSFTTLFNSTINYPANFSSTATVNALGVANGLTAGGISTSYTGSAFSHASVTGAGLQSLIDGDSGSILSYGLNGAGLFLLGGQTTVNFHYPSSDAATLLANELKFLANLPTGTTGNNVPEPASIALMGLGFAGMGYLRRRKTQA